jgi:hypothetical protein
LGDQKSTNFVAKSNFPQGLSSSLPSTIMVVINILIHKIAHGLGKLMFGPFIQKDLGLVLGVGVPLGYEKRDS